VKFETYIKENKRDKSELEFGNYLFGEYKKFYKTVKEPDTKDEADIFWALMSWVEQAGRRGITAQLLKKLLKYKKIYPKVLDSNFTTFYRVFWLPEKYSEVKEIRKKEFEWSPYTSKFHEDKTEEEKDKAFKKFSKSFISWLGMGFDYKPRYTIESWTTSKTKARSFAMKAGHIGGHPLMQEVGHSFIIKADLQQGEILMNPKFMNIASVDKGWWPQNEVIRLSKTPVKAKAFLLAPLRELDKYRFPKKEISDMRAEIKKKWESF